MAKKKAKTADKAAIKTKSTKFTMRRMVGFVFFATFALLFSAPAVFLFICMIPTAVAAFVDKKQPKTLGLTVGAANLAGTVPNWLDILHVRNDPTYALQAVSRPETLLLAYGAAAVGWVIYYSMTRFIALLIIHKTESRAKKIQKMQKKLIDRWGPELKKKKKASTD